MKFLLRISLIATVILFSCGQKQTKVKTESKQTFHFDSTSALFQEIVINKVKDLRNVSIGDPFSMIQEDNKWIVSQDEFHKYYQIDINDYEFIEVVYDNYSGKVDQIGLDIFISDDSQAFDLEEDFINFFTYKYGEAKYDFNGDLIWNKSLNDSTVVVYNLKNTSSFEKSKEDALEKKIHIGISNFLTFE